MLASSAPLGTAFGFLFAAPVLNPIVLASTWPPSGSALAADRSTTGAFLLAVMLSLSLSLLPEPQLLERALLSERRMNQPLSSYGLLERSGGVIGTAGKPAATAERPTPQLVLERSTREFLQLLMLLMLGSLRQRRCRPGCRAAGC